MAESGHALHPAICRSDALELGVVVVACGGHCEALREKMNIRGRNRNAICNHPQTKAVESERRRAQGARRLIHGAPVTHNPKGTPELL